MAKGKHGLASAHRRESESQQLAESLKASLRDEKEAHRITSKVADRVPLLEARIAQLEADNEAMTSAEMEALKAKFSLQVDHIRDLEQRLLIAKRRHIQMSRRENLRMSMVERESLAYAFNVSISQLIHLVNPKMMNDGPTQDSPRFSGPDDLRTPQAISEQRKRASSVPAFTEEMLLEEQEIYD